MNIQNHENRKPNTNALIRRLRLWVIVQVETQVLRLSVLSCLVYVFLSQLHLLRPADPILMAQFVLLALTFGLLVALTKRLPSPDLPGWTDFPTERMEG